MLRKIRLVFKSLVFSIFWSSVCYAQVPEPISPTQGAEVLSNRAIVVRFTEQEGVDRYHVSRYDRLEKAWSYSDPNVPSSVCEEGVCEVELEGLAVQENALWRVRGHNAVGWGAWSSFGKFRVVEPVQPPVVEVVSPKDGAEVLSNRAIVVRFTEQEGVDRYHVSRYDRLEKAWSYSDPNVPSSVCEEGVCEVELEGLAVQENALWRVRGHNAVGWGAWSSFGKFRVVEPVQPPVVEVVSPKDGAEVLSNRAIVVRFTEQEGVDRYHVSRYDRLEKAWSYSDPNVPSSVCEEGVCEVELEGLAVQENALWRVRGHNAVGWGAWSSFGKFRVVEPVQPPVVEVVSPKDGAEVLSNRAIVVRFTEQEGVDRYHVSRYDRLEKAWSYSDPNVPSSVCEEGVCEVELEGLAVQENALWRVRGHNAVGWGAWSSFGKFRVVEPVQPPVVEVVSPKDGAEVLSNRAIVVRFTEQEGVDRYHVSRYDRLEKAWSYSDPNVPSSVCEEGVCEVELEGLAVQENALWRVRGHNAMGWGAWSSFGKFRVVEPVQPYVVSTGGDSTCFIVQGDIACTGRLKNIEIPDLVGPKNVSVGNGHACAFSDDAVICWGDHNSGSELITDTFSNPVSVSTGEHHNCAIDDNGYSCWGSMIVGSRLIPDMLTSGHSFNCMLINGSVSCDGTDFSGNLDVPYLQNALQITTGRLHSCALDDAGVHCWGDNQYGQLDVPVLNNPVYVATGNSHSCAIDDNGVACWGSNEYGQLDVPALIKPVSLSSGGDHQCAVDDNGVKCWGNNNLGQLEVPVSVAKPIERELLIGYFVDSVVIGASYSTESQRGVTNAEGAFSYYPGETVQFSAGPIFIGASPAQPIVTPFQLVDKYDLDDEDLLNTLQIIQSLDIDQDPSNGIVIDDGIMPLTGPGSLTNGNPLSSNTKARLDYVESLLGLANKALVRRQAVRDHFADTAAKLATDTYQLGTDIAVGTASLLLKGSQLQNKILITALDRTADGIVSTADSVGHYLERQEDAIREVGEATVQRRVPSDPQTLATVRLEQREAAYLANRVGSEDAPQSWCQSEPVNGWIVCDVTADIHTGFIAAVYKRQLSDQYVISFGGTLKNPPSYGPIGNIVDAIKDIYTDLTLIGNLNPVTGDLVLDYLDKIVAPDYIPDGQLEMIVGHSLGGGLAQLAGLYKDVRTVTFNTAPLPLDIITTQKLVEVGALQVQTKNTSNGRPSTKVTALGNRASKITNIYGSGDIISFISDYLEAAYDVNEGSNPVVLAQYVVKAVWLSPLTLDLDYLITGDSIVLPIGVGEISGQYHPMATILEYLHTGVEKDSDFDGISDADEIALGLNPNNPDSDGDGLSDLIEIVDIDSPSDIDFDGVIDALEPGEEQADPCVPAASSNSSCTGMNEYHTNQEAYSALISHDGDIIVTRDNACFTIFDTNTKNYVDRCAPTPNGWTIDNRGSIPWALSGNGEYIFFNASYTNYDEVGSNIYLYAYNINTDIFKIISPSFEGSIAVYTSGLLPFASYIVADNDGNVVVQFYNSNMSLSLYNIQDNVWTGVHTPTFVGELISVSGNGKYVTYNTPEYSYADYEPVRLNLDTLSWTSVDSNVTYTQMSYDGNFIYRNDSYRHDTDTFLLDLYNPNEGSHEPIPPTEDGSWARGPWENGLDRHQKQVMSSDGRYLLFSNSRYAGITTSYYLYDSRYKVTRALNLPKTTRETGISGDGKIIWYTHQDGLSWKSIN